MSFCSACRSLMALVAVMTDALSVYRDANLFTRRCNAHVSWTPSRWRFSAAGTWIVSLHVSRPAPLRPDDGVPGIHRRKPCAAVLVLEILACTANRGGTEECPGTAMLPLACTVLNYGSRTRAVTLTRQRQLLRLECLPLVCLRPPLS